MSTNTNGRVRVGAWLRALGLLAWLAACAGPVELDEDGEAELGMVEQAVFDAKKPRLMVVGDSISQGHEGDFTWRYRLAEHLKKNGVQPTFVGPWTGTDRLGPPGGTSPSHSGEYRKGITFDQNRHNAEWGWMMGEAKWVIADRVTTYTPDILLVELGFNDIAWNLSDTPADEIASGVLDSLEQLVINARAAKSDIKVLIADVPQRTPIESYPALPGKISAYNSKLDARIAKLNKSDSPVVRVYFDLLYNEKTDSYDGIHPNVRGEHVIAQAFASELFKFGVGKPLTLPGSFDANMQPGPTSWLQNTPNADFTATMRWNHVFGAGGFWIWTRDLTKKEVDFGKLPFPVGADGWDPSSLPAGHVIEYKLQTAHGDYASAFSPVSTLRVPNLAAVNNVRTSVSPYTVTLSWDPVANADDYHIYAGSNCEGAPNPKDLTLAAYGLGKTTTWTQTYITSLCINYYVVASRNGGESPQPTSAIRVWPINTLMYGQLLQWLVDEIDRNMHSETANVLRRDHLVQALQPVVLGKWYELVKANAVWDHKPLLARFLTDGHPDPLYTRVTDRADRSVFYDIWSNIHYGMVGRSIGFSELLLQVAPDIAIPGTGGLGFSASDTAAVQIGFSLWNQFGMLKPTTGALHRAILERMNVLNSKPWQAGMH